MGTLVSSLIGLRNGGFASESSLSVSKILASGQAWRLLSCHFPFSSLSELLIGISFLYEMRKIERMMGVEKFGSFVSFVTATSTTLLAGLGLSFGVTPSTGPLPLVCAFLVLHQIFVPSTQPRLVRLLGVDFSDKAPLFFFAAPLVLSQGAASVLPAACGTFAGYLYASNFGDVQSWRLPKFIQATFQLLLPLIESSPSEPPQPQRRAQIPRDREPRNEGDHGHHFNREEEAFLRNDAPVVPASEDDILTLMGMGFERDQVVAALSASGNSVQIAADRLLSST